MWLLPRLYASATVPTKCSAHKPINHPNKPWPRIWPQRACLCNVMYHVGHAAFPQSGMHLLHSCTTPAGTLHGQLDCVFCSHGPALSLAWQVSCCPGSWHQLIAARSNRLMTSCSDGPSSAGGLANNSRHVLSSPAGAPIILCRRCCCPQCHGPAGVTTTAAAVVAAAVLGCCACMPVGSPRFRQPAQRPKCAESKKKPFEGFNTTNHPCGYTVAGLRFQRPGWFATGS